MLAARGFASVTLQADLGAGRHAAVNISSALVSRIPSAHYTTAADGFRASHCAPSFRHGVVPGLGRGFASQGAKVSEAPAATVDSNGATQEWTEAKRRSAAAKDAMAGPEAGSRVGSAITATKNGIVAVGNAIRSLPSKVARLASMTPEERKAGRQRIWKETKEVAHHYWVGTKLLWIDMKVSSRLTGKILRGQELSRREKRQLTRTAADMFRLVPMVVILVVPFLEFALPVLLKIFPNMLPSTYEDKLKKEEEVKRGLKGKLEMAKFLQDTVAEMASEILANPRGRHQATAAELVEFVNKVRAGEAVSNNEILRFAPLFNDELTLDNLDRVHLISMCRFVGIQPFGTDAFLRSRIRAHVRQLKEDDRAIQAEGLASLTDSELREACRARAMRAPYGPHSREFMEMQMQEWLDLSLGHSLPSSLLLMSRAMTISTPLSAHKDVVRGRMFEGLVDTLQSLPDEVVETVESEVETKAAGHPKLPGTSDRAIRAAQLEAKIDLIKQEEEAIREEEEEAREREAALGFGKQGPGAAAAGGKGKKVDLSEAAPPTEDLTERAARAVVRAAAIHAVAGLRKSAGPLPNPKAAALGGISEQELNYEAQARRDRRVNDVIKALATLAAPSSLASEKETFLDLVKADVARMEKEAADRGTPQLLFGQEGLVAERPEDKAAESSVPLKALTSRVESLITKLDVEIKTADQALQGRLRLLDLDGDGRISRQELEQALGLMQEKLDVADMELLYAKLGWAKTDGSVAVEALLGFKATDNGSSN